jgi:cytochrome P450
MLPIDGGFDTTTVRLAHSLEWLSEEPGERARLIQKLGILRDRASSTNSGWPSP